MVELAESYTHNALVVVILEKKCYQIGRLRVADLVYVSAASTNQQGLVVIAYLNGVGTKRLDLKLDSVRFLIRLVRAFRGEALVDLLITFIKFYAIDEAKFGLIYLQQEDESILTS